MSAAAGEEVTGDGVTVVGRRKQVTRRDWAIRGVLTCWYLIYSIVRGRYELPIFFLLLILVVFLLERRPSTVVSTGGIGRPWRRPRFIGWSEVASVAKPLPGSPGTQLQLVNGKTVTLADIPADESASVAHIGGKAVQSPAIPTKPPREKARTDDEIMADVTRRASALAEQRAKLAEQSRRLRGS